MRKLFASAISLLIGLAIGSYAGSRYSERHVWSVAVQQMMQEREESAYERAARAVLVINAVEAGDRQEILRSLSYPIALYYSQYADIRRHDQHSTNLIDRIEQLAKTNAIVASRIEEVKTNLPSK